MVGKDGLLFYVIDYRNLEILSARFFIYVA